MPGSCTTIQSLSHDQLEAPDRRNRLCQDLAKQHAVGTAFKDENTPKPLPKDVSLCLFRVAQEALRNAVRYSGASQFSVEMSGTAGEVQLEVRDAGAGFDLEGGRRAGGLGLVSMAERIDLVHGRLQVESSPGEGTRIVASVPLVAEKRGPRQDVEDKRAAHISASAA